MSDERFVLPSEADPLVGREGSPLGYATLAAQAVSPSNISQFYQDRMAPTINEGLGLAGSGLRSAGEAMGSGLSALTPSRDTLYKLAQGLEAAGAVGRGATPLYLQQQHLDLQRQQMQETALDRRQQMALQIQQQKAKQNEQQFNEFLALDKQFSGDPEQWDTQMKLQSAQGNAHARLALEVGDKKMRGEYASVAPLIETYFPDFAQRYAKDPTSVDKSEMRATLNNVGKIKDRRALADADASEYGALQKVFEKSQVTGESMNMGDLERFQQLHNDKTKKSLELVKLQSEIDRNKMSADQGKSPVRNDMTDIPAMATFGTPFAEIPVDATVTPQHIQNARAANFETSRLQVGMPARSAAAILGIQQAGKIAEQQGFGRGMGQGDVPVGVDANQYTRLLPDGTAQGIQDPAMGKIDAGKQGYRDTVRFKENLDRADKAKTAMRTLGDLETYAKAIITAQGPVSTVLQGWTLGLEGVSKAGALTDLAPNGKRLTVGEVAALYRDKSEQVADQLARGGGMVGVATELDTLRSMKGLAGTYQTANMAEEKFRTFKKSFGTNLLQEYERAYGREGVPPTLRQRLTKGELPPPSRLPARQFLEQQHKSYKDAGYQDSEIKDLLKRDFLEMGYE